MRALFRIGAVLVAGGIAAGFGWHGDAGTPTLHQVVDNVVFDLAATSEGLTACLNTTNGAKLSGQYGVEVTALSEPDAWGEKLPKKIAVEDDYFHLPLRIDLKRSGGKSAPGELHFEAAACQTGGMCVPVEVSFNAEAVGVARRDMPCRS